MEIIIRDTGLDFLHGSLCEVDVWLQSMAFCGFHTELLHVLSLEVGVSCSAVQ